MRRPYVMPTLEEQITNCENLIKQAEYQQKKAQSEIDRLTAKVRDNPEISAFKDILHENRKWFALESGRIERYRINLEALIAQRS